MHAHKQTHTHKHFLNVFVQLCDSLSDNAQGRIPATHTKRAEGLPGEWTDQILYI